MEKLKIFLKPLVLTMLFCFLLGTSFAQSSTLIGSSRIANQSNISAKDATAEREIAVAGAVAAAGAAITAAYAAGYVIGTFARHAWDSFLIESKTNDLVAYAPLNFSKFDN